MCYTRARRVANVNWLDIVIIVVVATAAFSGWRVGSVKAMVTFVGMVAGVYLASVFHSQAGDAVGAVVENETLAAWLGYAVVFVIVMGAAFAAGAVIRKMLSMALLGWADRLAGATAGLVIAVGILMALLIPVRNSATLGLGDTIKNSSLASAITAAAPQLEAILPGSFDDLTDFLSEQLPMRS